MVGSGLLTLVALTRVGILHFWAAHDRAAPKLLVLEGLPVAALLVVCGALAWQAGAVLRYTQATADALHTPAGYIPAVMSAQPKPNPAPAQKAAPASAGRQGSVPGGQP